MPATNGAHRHQRSSRLGWIKIGDLKPHPRAQREFRQHRADELVAAFNLEGMGFIVVSKHGDVYFIIDGQHRLAALLMLGFAPDDSVQCEVYEGLTDEQDAELFLERNNYLNNTALDKFRIGVLAKRKVEVEVDTCVRAQGLKVGRGGGIQAVGALMDAYRRTGIEGLGKTLRIIRDSYGERGFEGPVIQGTALTIQRYNGRLDEDQMIRALSRVVGGLGGLMTQAAKTRETLGQPKAQCIAATEITYYNRAGTKRVPGWWKEEAK